MRRETDRVIVELTDSASWTLERTASRQVFRIEGLKAKALADRTAADFALERESLAMLTPVVELANAGPPVNPLPNPPLP